MFLYSIAILLLSARELTRRALRRDWAAIRARLALGPKDDATSRVWVHAASNGELLSARPVLERLVEAGMPVLLTVNTDSALDLAHGWAMDGVLARLAPLDLPGATRRTYARHRVIGHITLESDLWPRRILGCPGPVLVLGGRLTERSARGWARLGGLARRVLARVSYLSAQDAGSRDRFRALGLPEVATGPVVDLKALYTPPVAAPGPDMPDAFDRSDTWLAASTHEGEDEIVLSAHKSALRQRPDLRLILAPRHPRRGDAIAALTRQTGLTLARRSLGDDPAGAQVYLADTMGEMHLWYASAGITFVAGSLTDRGGHTPYEPAAFGSAILHGPDTANFRDAYARLHAADAAREVAGPDALAQALIALADAETRNRMATAAQAALAQDTDLDGLMRGVIAALTP